MGGGIILSTTPTKGQFPQPKARQEGESPLRKRYMPPLPSDAPSPGSGHLGRGLACRRMCREQRVRMKGAGWSPTKLRVVQLEAMEQALGPVYHGRLPLHNIFDRSLLEYVLEQRPHSFKGQPVPLLVALVVKAFSLT